MLVGTMTQPTTRRRSTTLTAVLSSFFYNDSVDVTLSPLTCAQAADPDGQADTSGLLSSDPHDRSAMMARLRTFKPGHWFAKPAQVSALICASHGWTNSGMDQLTCPCCKSTLSYKGTRAAKLDDASSALAAFVTQLRAGHHERCPWAHSQADCSVLVAFPTAPPTPIWQAFIERLAQLCEVDALPMVSSKGLSKLAQQRFPQLLTLLDASSVPVQSGDVDAGLRKEVDEGTAQELVMLSRRSRSFSQAAKLLALLGWTIRPLAGRQKGPEGMYSMKDCMLTCSACGAVVGLWSVEAAPDTFRMLGYHGLLGKWGAGAVSQSHSLKTLSIAGAVAGSDAPSSRGSSARLSAPSILHTAKSGASTGGTSEKGDAAFGANAGPFGCTTAAPVFGTQVSLAANAMTTEQPFGSKNVQRKASCTKAPATVGLKRKRNDDTAMEGDGENGVHERVAKVMRKLSARQQASLPPDVCAKLSERGLQVGDADALEIVHGHRAWCPWVAPDQLEGWQRTLNAVVPEDAVTAGTGGVEHVLDEQAAEDRRAPGTASSLLHQVGGFLSRLNRGSSAVSGET